MISTSVDRRPILIVGMHRSGTTLVSRLLERLPGVHFEMEPQVLWKAGNFRYLADTRYDIKLNVVSWIRNRLLGATGDRILVEKSPTNCIRPHLVHATFPDAKIVYVERDPVRCIHSNLTKTLAQTSFDPAVLCKKYLFSLYSWINRGNNAWDAFDQPLEAGGGRPLHKQLRLPDLPMFSAYVTRMIYIRNVLQALPFGPKLEGFVDIMRREGPLGYQVKVHREAEACKKVFQDLYGSSFALFRLERIHTSVEEIRNIYHFCGFSANEEYVHDIFKSFNPRIISRANEPGEYDRKILQMLNSS